MLEELVLDELPEVELEVLLGPLVEPEVLDEPLLDPEDEDDDDEEPLLLPLLPFELECPQSFLWSQW